MDRHNDKRPTVRKDDSERPIIPLPKETLEDVDLLAAAELSKRSAADEAYEEFVRKGGVDLLPGKGKPLVVPTGDIMETIMRQANVPPPWIMLRRELQGQLKKAAELLHDSPQDPEIDELIRTINEKIDLLNSRAPGLSQHRKKITRNNLQEQLEKWI